MIIGRGSIKVRIRCFVVTGGDKGCCVYGSVAEGGGIEVKVGVRARVRDVQSVTKPRGGGSAGPWMWVGREHAQHPPTQHPQDGMESIRHKQGANPTHTLLNSEASMVPPPSSSNCITESQIS